MGKSITILIKDGEQSEREKFTITVATKHHLGCDYRANGNPMRIRTCRDEKVVRNILKKENRNNNFSIEIIAY